MELKLNSKLLLNSLLLLPSLIFSQVWQKVDSIQLTKSPSAISADFQGNLYFGFEDGSMIKYTKGYLKPENYSLPNQSSITTIDTQNSLRLFIFQIDNQQVTILDRFNTTPRNYDLFDFGLEYVTHACPSVDQDIWTLEINPERLKKIDPLRNQVKLEVQLDIGDSIFLMKTFQNLLILSSAKGTYIFDQYGNKVNEIDLVNLQDVSLTNDKLYSINDLEHYAFDIKKEVVTDSSYLSQTYEHVKILNKEELLAISELTAYKLKLSTD